MKPPKHFTFYLGRNLCEARQLSNDCYLIKYLDNNENASGEHTKDPEDVVWYILNRYWIIKSVIAE